MKRLKAFFEWNHGCLSASAHSFVGFEFAGCAGFFEAVEGCGWPGDWLKFNVAVDLLGGDGPVLLDTEIAADVGFGLGAIDRMAPPRA